jgi:menaquinone-dependent protoporphyrinogen oxidase
MKVLITWGTKLGGTEGIARTLGEVLTAEGFDVTLTPAREVRDPRGYEAVLVGGALYANRWHVDARRFVARNVAALRRVPVWFFSSGPLDDSAAKEEIPPPTQVAVLMERVGALGHATFGGRLPADARGFPAAAMAKEHAGDWRDPDHIRAWATTLARALPDARPGVAIDHEARSLPRLLSHGVAAWTVCTAAMAGLLMIASSGVATALYVLLVPFVFALSARRYFRARGAREPLPTAVTFAAVAGVLDAIVSAMARGAASFHGFWGVWLPLALIFLTTWMVGFLLSTMPWSKAPDDRPHPTDHHRGAPQGA